MIFELEMPARALFGRGVRFELFSALKPGKTLLLCGKHSTARIESEKARLFPAGTTLLLQSGFPAEAPLDELEKLLTFARREKVDSIVAWGGGSCIDAAKAAAALLNAPMSAAEAFRTSASLPKHTCFFAALPTTAGTAAEMSPNAVIHDPETGIKKSLRGEGMFADLALIDPELLDDAPDPVIFGAGFDALTQGIESAISRKSDNLSRLVAIEGAYLSFFGLKAASAGDRSPAISDMLCRGSMLTGAAFVRSGLGAVHGIGHPVSGLRGVPHGVCCGILLPVMLKRNLECARFALKELALRFGIDTPERLIEEIEVLRSECQIPADFKPWGVRHEDIPFIVANCRSGSMKCNPRELSDAEVQQIMESLI